MLFELSTSIFQVLEHLRLIIERVEKEILVISYDEHYVRPL